jgi:hypothetical protein
MSNQGAAATPQRAQRTGVVEQSKSCGEFELVPHSSLAGASARTSHSHLRSFRESPLEVLNLFAVCGIAFGAVFLLLAFLAFAMHLITLFFPERRAATDPAMVAAISSTVAALYPGACVTRIEEES